MGGGKGTVTAGVATKVKTKVSREKSQARPSLRVIEGACCAWGQKECVRVLNACGTKRWTVTKESGGEVETARVRLWGAARGFIRADGPAGGGTCRRGAPRGSGSPRGRCGSRPSSRTSAARRQGTAAVRAPAVEPGPFPVVRLGIGRFEDAWWCAGLTCFCVALFSHPTPGSRPNPRALKQPVPAAVVRGHWPAFTVPGGRQEPKPGLGQPFKLANQFFFLVFVVAAVFPFCRRLRETGLFLSWPSKPKAQNRFSQLCPRAWRFGVLYRICPVQRTDGAGIRQKLAGRTKLSLGTGGRESARRGGVFCPRAPGLFCEPTKETRGSGVGMLGNTATWPWARDEAPRTGVPLALAASGRLLAAGCSVPDSATGCP